MKKYILTLAAVIIASTAYTQTNKEEVDLMQAAFGIEKKAVVADFVQLTDTQKDAFWALYDEYEAERKDLGKERIVLLNQYAEQYLTMTSEQADTWTKKVMDLQRRTDKLITKYYGKVKNVADAVVATQFYQIEYYILSQIRMKLLEEIPFLRKDQ